MAYDKSPPQVRIIAGFMVGTLIALVLLHWAFISYFSYRMNIAKLSAVTAPRELETLRADEEKALEGQTRSSEGQWRGIQIGKKMYVREERQNLSEIAPQNSQDSDPLKGWLKLQPHLKNRVQQLSPSTNASQGASDVSPSRSAKGGA